jgi:hypothetical protein
MDAIEGFRITVEEDREQLTASRGTRGDTMNRKFVMTLLTVLAFATLALAATIPAGTKVTVRTGSEMSSGTAKTGETWEGTLVKDLVVNGKTVAKAGDRVTGKVTNAKSSGRLHAPGILTVRLTAVNGMPVTSSAYSVRGKSHTKSNAVKIGGGTAAGAVIGGIAGGGKGALIGSAVGAGAGTGVAAATGKQEAVIPAEAAITFTVSGK